MSMRTKTMILLCAPWLACTVRNLDDTSGTSGTSGTTTGEPTSGAPTTSGLAVTLPTATATGTGGIGSSSDSATTGTTGPELPPAETCGFACETCGFACETAGDFDPCDPFAQDCPDGEKCAPFGEEWESFWHSNKCVPVTGDGQPGDACTAVGNGLSGLDDCAKRAMCWDVDVEGHGYCIELCSGTQEAAVCSDPGTACTISAGGYINICIVSCDALLQDCPWDKLCVPSGEYFLCAPDASGDEGQVFDPCEFVNVCDKGLMCAPPNAASECDANAGGCCLPFCALDDPGFVCPGVGQVCVALYDEGQAPEEFENIGSCTLPP